MGRTIYKNKTHLYDWSRITRKSIVNYTFSIVIADEPTVQHHCNKIASSSTKRCLEDVLWIHKSKVLPNIYDFRTKDVTSMSLMFLVYFRTISLLSPSPSGRSNFWYQQNSALVTGSRAFSQRIPPLLMRSGSRLKIGLKGAIGFLITLWTAERAWSIWK